MKTYGIILEHHIIAANKGNFITLAAYYHLVTEKVPIVYMENSGEETIYIIDLRSEPWVHDDAWWPSTYFQSWNNLKLFEDLDIKYFVVSKWKNSMEFWKKEKEK